ncbi:IclR family transcriptional regulator [Sneathiella glossodoripedis]|uniref:IclR family transcriptional regulator n=1 Tax=Sneathiella glossodoripedis TaxID=418853 RepID=UPI000471D5B4|nr:IclR family transcriptional regulator C-terminal domain-containing protein [Sneathiella glossodoripedis]
MSETLSDKEISLTFMKGLQVLAVFDATNREMTISDIAKKTKLNRTVVRRLLLTLEMMNYVECRNRLYRLTPRILRLAGGFLQSREIGKYATPILTNYSRIIRESISFAMLDGDEAVYVAHSPGDPAMITMGFTVGSRLPLHATAIGRTLLSFVEQNKQQELLKSISPRAYTPCTLTDKEDIIESLKESASLGYCLVQDEFEEGVTSLGVPVQHESGTLIGALGIVGPNPRFSDKEILENKKELLVECAASIAAIL